MLWPEGGDETDSDAASLLLLDEQVLKVSELCERRLVVALTSSVLVVVVVMVLEQCRWRMGDVLPSACVVRVFRNNRIDCEYNSGLKCDAEVSLLCPRPCIARLWKKC